MAPFFEVFDPFGSVFYASTRSNLPTFSAFTHSFMSLSHLDILGPKVGLTFNQNVLFNSFEVFYINIFFVLRSFDHSFLQNLRSNQVHLFYCVLNLVTENVVTTYVTAANQCSAYEKTTNTGPARGEVQ